MKRNPSRRLITLIAAITALIFGLQAAAQAVPWERDFAVGTSNASCDGVWMQHDESLACFHAYGDAFIVYRIDNGAPTSEFWAYVQWVNELRNASGTWLTYRNGECVAQLDAGVVGACNKDFYEDSTSPNAFGGRGSRLNYKACAVGFGCSPPSGPVYNRN